MMSRDWLWKVCRVSVSLLLAHLGRYVPFPLNRRPAQLPSGRLSARQLGLSYRDITWEAELCLCLCLRLDRMPVALSACCMIYPSIHCSLLLPLPSIFPPTINVNINKDVTRLLDSAVQSVVVASNYHSQGKRGSGGFNPVRLDR